MLIVSIDREIREDGLLVGILESSSHELDQLIGEYDGWPEFNQAVRDMDIEVVDPLYHFNTRVMPF